MGHLIIFWIPTLACRFSYYFPHKKKIHVYIWWPFYPRFESMEILYYMKISYCKIKLWSYNVSITIFPPGLFSFNHHWTDPYRGLISDFYFNHISTRIKLVTTVYFSRWLLMLTKLHVTLTYTFFIFLHRWYICLVRNLLTCYLVIHPKETLFQNMSMIQLVPWGL